MSTPIPIPQTQTIVAQYNNTAEFQAHLAQSNALGYQLTHVTNVPGHINIGRSLLRIIFTGGIGLFFPSRTPARIIATYNYVLPNAQA